MEETFSVWSKARATVGGQTFIRVQWNRHIELGLLQISEEWQQAWPTGLPRVELPPTPLLYGPQLTHSRSSDADGAWHIG